MAPLLSPLPHATASDWMTWFSQLSQIVGFATTIVKGTVGLRKILLNRRERLRSRSL